jgi:hypothetical protein
VFPSTQHKVDTVVIRGDPLCNEAGEYLREYGKHLQKLYMEGSPHFGSVYKLINDVVEYRQTLLSGKITSDNLQSLKGKLTISLDLLNNKLGLSMVPRNELGDPVEPDKCSCLNLFQTHQTTTEDLKTAEDSSSQFGGRRTSLTPASSRGTATPGNQSHHLYMSIDSVNHTFTEDCEVFFSLYDKDSKQFMTERVCMVVSKTAGTTSIQRKAQSALFVELGNRDLFLRSPYLVCHVVRKSGQMLFENKKYQSNHTFRRPYACGVLDPSSVLKPFAQNETNDEERAPEEYVMPLSVIAKDNNMDFLTFQDQAIKKMAAKGVTFTDKSGFSLHVTLQLYKGDLEQVKNYSPKLNYVTLVKRLGFPEIILPGDVRNDIYITIEKGEYEKGQKSAERNVEVSVTVCDESGTVIENGLCTASGLPPVTEYQSFIFYHNNSPKWGEVLKLNLSFDVLQKAHVRLTFRHLAKNEKSDKADKTFAFAFLKVMTPDGSIVPDGTHELCTYKSDNKKWKNAKQYLTMPSLKTQSLATLGSQASTSSAHIQRSSKEAIWISTLCCSTKMTQKIELLSLLKWKVEPEKLNATLDNLVVVPGSEIFKFLQDTLDCLFQILTENADRYRTRVFNVLIYILGFLYQGTFQHFRPVLDLYVSKLFSASLAYGALMSSLNELLKSWDKEATANQLCKVFEVLDPLFGFIAQSHKLYLKQKATEGTLSLSLHNFFVGLLPIMKASTDVSTSMGKTMANLQSAILLNIPSILEALLSVMERGNITSHVAELLSTVPLTQPALYHPRLMFMKKLLESSVKLVGYKNSRETLLPKLVVHLEDFMQNRVSQLPHTSDVTFLCISTVGLLTEALQNSNEPPSGDDVKHVMKLLQPIMTLCVVLDRKLPVAVGNWVNLLGVLHLCSSEDFDSFCANLGGIQLLSQFIKDIFSLTRRAVSEPFFEEKWLTMHLVQNSVLLKIIRCCFKLMKESFLTSANYDEELFQECIRVCADFSSQPSLQMANMSQLVQDRLQERFGDLRLEIGAVLVKLWCSLGNEHKEGFIVSSMNDLLRISLVRMPELRKITIPLIWDLVEVDMATLGGIKRVEVRLLEKLDDLLFGGSGDEEYKELFSQIMMRKCNAAPDDLTRMGEVLVVHVTRLIELSFDYRNVPNDDYNKDKRMGCMFNLLNFYHEIERQELYVRYVYKLSELHRRDEKYTEAALTLLLHGDKLKWVDPVVEAEGKYPKHSQKARKEQLFKEAIQLFDLGKSWELGIRLCKELATVYEETLFDYHKLGAMLETQAQFFRKIISELRVDPEYFRVGYYGKGFPHFLRNKAFIHRGLPYEKLSAIKHRLSYEFPKAEFLTYTTPPPDSINDSPGQHLQLYRVNPVPEDRAIFVGKDVDDKILGYYNCNDVKTFKYDRPFHRGEKDKSNEFASLWIERTTMIASSPFPGVLSYFPIISDVKVEINPLELAVESVENKNREIQTLTNACMANVAFPLQTLTMVLNGVIDAAVNGGTANYRKVFFADVYLRDNPDREELVKKLRKLLEDQCNLLGRGLEAHAKRISGQEEGLHLHMTEMYKNMRYIVFPHEAPKESPKKPSFGGVPRSTTMKGRELPPTPVQIKEPAVPRGATMNNRPRRMPSSKVPKGNLIQQSLNRPPPPSIAAPPPPVQHSPPKPSSMYVDPYEVVEIEDKDAHLDKDDYEEPEAMENIRKSLSKASSSTSSSRHSLQDTASTISSSQTPAEPIESFYSTETYDMIDSGPTQHGGISPLRPTVVDKSDEGNVYGFDKLSDKPPVVGTPDSAATTPSVAGTSQECPYGYDHLDDLPSGPPPSLPPRPPKPVNTPQKTEPETPPRIPEKKRKTMRKSNAISESSLNAADETNRPTSPLVRNGVPVPLTPGGSSSSITGSSPLSTSPNSTTVTSGSVDVVQQRKNPHPVPRPRSTADSPGVKPHGFESPPTPRPRKGSAAAKQNLGASNDTPPVLPPKPSGSTSSAPSQSPLLRKSPEPVQTPPPLPQKPGRQPSITSDHPKADNPPPPLPGRPSKEAPQAPPTASTQGKKLTALLSKFQEK